DHPWAVRPYVEPADFSGARLFLLTEPATSSMYQLILAPARVKPKEIANVQMIGALASLVEGGFGVGVAPSWTLSPEIRSGRLVAVRIGRKGCPRQWIA